jgi:class 3 adenylate cyclase
MQNGNTLEWVLTMETLRFESSKEGRRREKWACPNPEEDGNFDDLEEFVRADARTVKCIRQFLIAVLAGATVMTAVVNSILLTRVQMRGFADDFETISSRLVQSFAGDLRSKLWQAYSISVTLTGTDVLSYSIPFFSELYQANRATSCSSRMVFSPLLYDETARKAWEQYAISIIRRSGGAISGVSCNGNILDVPGSSEMIEITSPQESSWDGLNANPRLDCPLNGKHVLLDKSQSFCNNTQIFDIGNGDPVKASDPPYSPTWQVSSAKTGIANMYNQMSDPMRRDAIMAVIKSKHVVLSPSIVSPSSDFEKLFGSSTSENGPGFSLFYPIFSDLGRSQVLATLSLDFSWTSSLEKILPLGSEGMDLVLKNTCGQAFTFSVNHGLRLNYRGEGDLHDPTFDTMTQGSKYEDYIHLQNTWSNTLADGSSGKTDCKYMLRAYPSAAFLDRYNTSSPSTVTTAMVVMFLFTSLVFFTYDRLVKRLQTKVMRSAVRYNAFLSTLFPSNVRSRLFKTAETVSSFEWEPEARKEMPRTGSFLPRLMETPKLQLMHFLASAPQLSLSNDSISEEPIADLFPHTTVFFADIAGFTAWSSEREPLYVFKLLETLYSAFDRIAARLGVFKVETVGDCYVAVTGLPEPQADHAIIMAKFAKACLLSMRELTRSLESVLGPSTASLALRIGMHSGPVIAGVLRGERSRFQLFGDTMNTASRMESTGVINKIQVSQTTADLLTAAGNTDWITPREDHVIAKGKGSMKTYWVAPGLTQSVTSVSGSGIKRLLTKDCEQLTGAESESNLCNLVDWNVDLLCKHLQKIVAIRRVLAPVRPNDLSMTLKPSDFDDSKPRDEVVEALAMPEFSSVVASDPVDPALVNLPASVRRQVRSFVTRIASMYHKENAFHNFEHASHVAMSSNKLLKRIMAPDGIDYNQRSLHKNKRIEAIAKEIHEATFGISSDPLLQFAAVFSALVHDVDHDGVPNLQLSIEMSPIAVKYQHKSVAEQHSVDTAWHLLMEDEYEDLRSCIYETECEMRRFRQLVVNAVIATDIADESLQLWREARWDRAFHTDNFDPERNNRKASIVFAYILQASDVAHTMQHWHTYRKWNERLFTERYSSFQQGLCSQDPSLSWYEDEISFLETYVIPLAGKLEECGVFGVSSHENLSYALQNRDEWVSKGKAIVEETVAKLRDGDRAKRWTN